MNVEFFKFTKSTCSTLFFQFFVSEREVLQQRSALHRLSEIKSVLNLILDIKVCYKQELRTLQSFYILLEEIRTTTLFRPMPYQNICNS